MGAATLHMRALARRARWLATPRGGLVLLIGAYAVSAGYLISQAARVRSYIWLIDELLYIKIAQGFSQGMLPGPHVFGHSVDVSNSLYPLLLSPLYWLLNSPHAFTAAHVLNGLLFASTMFPVYLLARRVRIPPAISVLTGLLSVWIPWAVATTVMMTESLAYPLFAWAILAIILAVGQARPRNDALAVVAIGLASYARTQFILLFVVLVVAVVLHEIGFHDTEQEAKLGDASKARWWRDALRPHLPMLLVLTAGLLVALIARSAGHELLGNYAVLVNGRPFPDNLWSSAMTHLAHVFVGVGMLPAILWFAWLAATFARPQAKIEHACAIVLMLAAVTITYEAAFIAQTAAGSAIQERYVLYLAPLLFVGAVHLISRPPRRAPRLAILLAGIAVAAVIGESGFGETEAGAAFSNVQNASAAFNPVIDQRLAHFTAGVFGNAWPTVNSLAAIAILLSVLAAAVISARRVTLAIVLLLVPVFAYVVDETRYVLPRTVAAINVAYPDIVLPTTRATPRNWIDAATYHRHGSVGLLPGILYESNESQLWMWTEFWNKSITVLYSTPSYSDGTGFSGTPIHLDPKTGRLLTSDEQPFLVTSGNDPSLGVRGTLIYRSSYGAVLLAPERPYRAAWAIVRDTNGVVEAGSPLKLLVYQTATPSVETLTVTVASPSTAGRELTVAAGVGRERVRLTLVPGGIRKLSFQLRLLPTKPPAVLSLSLEGPVTHGSSPSAPAAPQVTVIGAGLTTGPAG